MMLWREYDHPPPLDMAWALMRMRIAHAFGWTLATVDDLSPQTVADLVGYLMSIPTP